MWFKRTRIAYRALMISMLTLSVTGVVVASTGQFNPISEKMQLRAESIEAAVDSGELTREEAYEKRLEMRERLDEGGKRFKRMGEWKRVSSEDIEARLQAAVDAGGITQEEADSIWDKLNVATTQ